MNRPQALDKQARNLLTFWFGDGEEYGKSRKQWFAKDAAFDDAIRARFAALHAQAAAGNLAHWSAHPLDNLALIILLDQFPRNMFRGSAAAFASDVLALAAAKHALARGDDHELLPVERQFIYLPLEHSESLTDQDQCLARMTELVAFAETRELHVWAEKHRVIIQRFGRFPHRNAILGRTSTPAEIEFLKEPGSGF